MERWLWLLPLVVLTSLVVTSRGQSSDFESEDEGTSRNEENCPCILRDQCPRVYGISDLDFKELGKLNPCEESDMVRCCGVTVSMVRKEDVEDKTDAEEYILLEEEESSDFADLDESESNYQADHMETASDLLTSESKESYTYVPSPQGQSYSRRRNPGPRARPGNSPTEEPNPPAAPAATPESTDATKLNKFKTIQNQRRTRPGYSSRGKTAKSEEASKSDDSSNTATTESSSGTKRVSDPVPVGKRLSPMKKLNINSKYGRPKPAEEPLAGLPGTSEATATGKEPGVETDTSPALPSSEKSQTPAAKSSASVPPQALKSPIEMKRNPMMKKLKIPYPKTPLGYNATETSDSPEVSTTAPIVPPKAVLSSRYQRQKLADRKSSYAENPAAGITPEISPIVPTIAETAAEVRVTPPSRRLNIGSLRKRPEIMERNPIGESSSNKPVRVYLQPAKPEHPVPQNPSVTQYQSNLENNYQVDDADSYSNRTSTANEKGNKGEEGVEEGTGFEVITSQDIHEPSVPPMNGAPGHSFEAVQTPHLRRKSGIRRKLVHKLKTTQGATPEFVPIASEPQPTNEEEQYPQEVVQMNLISHKQSSTEPTPIEASPVHASFGARKRTRPLIKSVYVRPGSQIVKPATANLEPEVRIPITTTESSADTETVTLTPETQGTRKITARHRGAIHGRIRISAPPTAQPLEIQTSDHRIEKSDQVDKYAEPEYVETPIRSPHSKILEQEVETAKSSTRGSRIQVTSTYSKIRQNAQKMESKAEVKAEESSDTGERSKPVSTVRFSVPTKFTFSSGTADRIAEQTDTPVPHPPTAEPHRQRFTGHQNRRPSLPSRPNFPNRPSAPIHDYSQGQPGHQTAVEGQESNPPKATYPDGKDYDVVLTSEDRKPHQSQQQVSETKSANKFGATQHHNAEPTYSDNYNQEDIPNEKYENPSLNAFVDFDKIEIHDDRGSGPVQSPVSEWEGAPNHWNGYTDESRINETFMKKYKTQQNSRVTSNQSSQSNTNTEPVPQKRMRMKVKPQENKENGHVGQNTYGSVYQSPEPKPLEQSSSSVGNSGKVIQFDTVSTNNDANSQFQFPPYRRSEAKLLATTPAPSSNVVEFVSTRRPSTHRIVTDTRTAPESQRAPPSPTYQHVKSSSLTVEKSSSDIRPARFQIKNANFNQQKESQEATHFNQQKETHGATHFNQQKETHGATHFNQQKQTQESTHFNQQKETQGTTHFNQQQETHGATHFNQQKQTHESSISNHQDKGIATVTNGKAHVNNQNHRFSVNELGKEVAEPGQHSSGRIQKPYWASRPTEFPISHQIPATESVFHVNSIPVESVTSRIVEEHEPRTPPQTQSIRGGSDWVGISRPEHEIHKGSIQEMNAFHLEAIKSEEIEESERKPNQRFPVPQKFNLSSSTKSETKGSMKHDEVRPERTQGFVRFPDERPQEPARLPEFRQPEVQHINHHIQHSNVQQKQEQHSLNQQGQHMQHQIALSQAQQQKQEQHSFNQVQQQKQEQHAFNQVQQQKQEQHTFNQVQQQKQEQNAFHRAQSQKQEQHSFNQVQQQKQEQNAFHQAQAQKQEQHTFNQVQQQKQEQSHQFPHNTHVVPVGQQLQQPMQTHTTVPQPPQIESAPNQHPTRVPMTVIRIGEENLKNPNPVSISDGQPLRAPNPIQIQVDPMRQEVRPPQQFQSHPIGHLIQPNVLVGHHPSQTRPSDQQHHQQGFEIPNQHIRIEPQENHQIIAHPTNLPFPQHNSLQPVEIRPLGQVGLQQPQTRPLEIRPPHLELQNRPFEQIGQSIQIRPMEQVQQQSNRPNEHQQMRPMEHQQNRPILQNQPLEHQNNRPNPQNQPMEQQHIRINAPNHAIEHQSNRPITHGHLQPLPVDHTVQLTRPLPDHLNRPNANGQNHIQPAEIRHQQSFPIDHKKPEIPPMHHDNKPNRPVEHGSQPNQPFQFPLHQIKQIEQIQPHVKPFEHQVNQHVHPSRPFEVVGNSNPRLETGPKDSNRFPASSLQPSQSPTRSEVNLGRPEAVIRGPPGNNNIQNGATQDHQMIRIQINNQEEGQSSQQTLRFPEPPRPLEVHQPQLRIPAPPTLNQQPQMHNQNPQDGLRAQEFQAQLSQQLNNNRGAPPTNLNGQLNGQELQSQQLRGSESHMPMQAFRPEQTLFHKQVEHRAPPPPRPESHRFKELPHHPPPQPQKPELPRQPTTIRIENGEVKLPLNPELGHPKPKQPEQSKVQQKEQQKNFGPVLNQGQPPYVPFQGQVKQLSSPQIPPHQYRNQQQNQPNRQNQYQQFPRQNQTKRPLGPQSPRPRPAQPSQFSSFFNRLRNPTRTSRQANFTAGEDSNRLNSTEIVDLETASLNATEEEIPNVVDKAIESTDVDDEGTQELTVEAEERADSITEGSNISDKKASEVSEEEVPDKLRSLNLDHSDEGFGSGEIALKSPLNLEKKGFKAPKVIQRGFHPILPYSEKDPGLILVPIPEPKRDTFTPPITNLKGQGLHPNSLATSFKT